MRSFITFGRCTCVNCLEKLSLPPTQSTCSDHENASHRQVCSSQNNKGVVKVRSIALVSSPIASFAECKAWRPKRLCSHSMHHQCLPYINMTSYRSHLYVNVQKQRCRHPRCDVTPPFSRRSKLQFVLTWTLLRTNFAAPSVVRQGPGCHPMFPASALDE